MIGVHSDPGPQQIKDRNNGILQVVHNLAQALPEFGYEYVEDPKAAHIFAHHAGSANGMPVSVEHCHGLIPTAMHQMTEGADAINAAVIDNIIKAKVVTVPSEWVADILRRDMRIDPYVIPWGINHSEWGPGENRGYVLWAKGRADNVCTPVPMNKLASMAMGVPFVSTFGEKAENVDVIGSQPFFAMRDLVANAGVYLATTRETFGIQTVEAMACGVPVLGFRWAGNADIVRHRVTGYLAEPGNYDDLLAGLVDCMQNRQRYGEAAIEEAAEYTWQRAARMMAAAYEEAGKEHEGPEVSVIIPCFNYAHFVSDAIESVLRQNLPCEFEVIVVNDGSTDNSRAIIDHYSDRIKVIHKENGGVSSARMAGFRASNGRFVCFLDADDQIEQNWLQVNWENIRRNDRLGISYTKLQLLTNSGIRHAGWPPDKVDYLQLASGANQVPTCCMIRRTAFERAGGYKQRFEPTEDGELWARIAECGYTIECATKTPLFTYRLGHDSLSRGKTLPDYKSWHQPSVQGTPPCALPKHRGNYPVRDYDQPIFDIVIIHNGNEQALHDTLDALLAQSYMFWKCRVVYADSAQPDLHAYPFVKISDVVKRSIADGSAPLIVLTESGVIPHNRYLEAALRDWEAGRLRRGVMPRVWYNEMTEKEKNRWLAGEVVVEAAPHEAQEGDPNS